MELLRSIDNQFMLGPSILITPVLAPFLRESQGVFPDEVHAVPGQNVTLEAPLEHIPVYVRGGTVIAYQTPANTTTHMKQNPWTIIAALDSNQAASGELFLHDGVTIDPEDANVFQFSDNVFSIAVEGDYDGHATPLEMIEIVGWHGKPV
ncbi:glycosyl hydrolase family 31 [Paraphaeosphaeria sporulosa]